MRPRIVRMVEMARNDFLEALGQLNSIGILQISRDFYMGPKRRGVTWFVKSPVSEDKHWSCALDPVTNRFVDFSAGNTGGDCIRFVSYVRRTDNWQALQMLRQFYSLSDSREWSRDDIRRRIYVEEQTKQKRKARQREFRQALYGHINHLKATEENFERLLQQEEIRANYDVAKWLVSKLNIIGQKLDILCAVSPEYRRMKPNIERGLPSDWTQWLSDTLEILKDDGAFEATDEELKKIQSQAEFEVKRKSGMDRRCGIEW